MRKPANSTGSERNSVVSRRSVLRAAAVATALMTGFAGIGSALAATKTKKAANYQNKPKGSQRCGGCIHFSGGRCEIVSGGVSANGWCKFFTG